MSSWGALIHEEPCKASGSHTDSGACMPRGSELGYSALGDVVSCIVVVMWWV